MFKFFAQPFRQKNKNRYPFQTDTANAEPLSVSNEPDYPSPFGYKTTWYAVRCKSPAEVIEKLGMQVISESPQFTNCGLITALFRLVSTITL